MLGALAFERRDCGAAVAAFERSGSRDRQERRRPRAVRALPLCRGPLLSKLRPCSIATRLLAPGDPGPRVRPRSPCRPPDASAEALERVEPLARRSRADPAVIDLAADLTTASIACRGGRPPAPRHGADPCRGVPLRHARFDVPEARVVRPAREVIDVGLRHLPVSAPLHAMRGVVHAQLGNLAGATEDFETAGPPAARSAAGWRRPQPRPAADGPAGRLDRRVTRGGGGHPDDVPTLFLLGQALIGAGCPRGPPRRARPKRPPSCAVEQAPGFGEAHAELGKLYLKIGDPAHAVTHLRKAIALAPTDRTATYSLLLALRQAGRDDETPAVAARLRELMAQERDEEIRRNRLRLLKPDEAR